MKRRLLTWLAHQLWPYLQDIEAVEAEMRRRSAAAQAAGSELIDVRELRSLGNAGTITAGTIDGARIDGRPVRRFIGQ